jgi:hypothetical protein
MQLWHRHPPEPVMTFPDQAAQPDGTVITLLPDEDTRRRRSAQERVEAEIRREEDRQRITDLRDAYRRERDVVEAELARVDALPLALGRATLLRENTDRLAQIGAELERLEHELATFDGRRRP